MPWLGVQPASPRYNAPCQASLRPHFPSRYRPPSFPKASAVRHGRRLPVSSTNTERTSPRIFLYALRSPKNERFEHYPIFYHSITLSSAAGYDVPLRAHYAPTLEAYVTEPTVGPGRHIQTCTRTQAKHRRVGHRTNSFDGPVQL